MPHQLGKCSVQDKFLNTTPQTMGANFGHQRQTCLDLSEVLLNLGTVIQLLTQFSMDSMLGLLPEDMQANDILMQHYRDVVKICGPMQFSKDHLNSKQNKSYGQHPGGTWWSGNLQDGRDRGGMPYFCPSGWVRLSLNVCADSEFEEKYKGWGYLYHGTQGKYVGAILTSGLRGSTGLCYCGAEDSAVYFSPSIEYSGHPRYASIEYNPETRKWIQLVLQCRVNPACIWKVDGETLKCKEYGMIVDPNVANSEVEVLIKPNWTDPQTLHKFIKDGVVCTGVMMRVTHEHPLDLDYWWTQSSEYMKEYDVAETKVDSTLLTLVRRRASLGSRGTQCKNVKITSFASTGDPTLEDFRVTEIDHKTLTQTGMVLSSLPFAKGSMRYAYFLTIPGGHPMVVKKYNKANLEHINSRLKISMKEMLFRDVATYLAAKFYAEWFNKLSEGNEWKVYFVKPFIVDIDGELYFGEPFQDGKFVKWNDNTGQVNLSKEGVRQLMNNVVGTFSHFTYHASGENLMVVDIQGWDNNCQITFTDPQIHTRQVAHSGCQLAKKFSVGNLGRAGMCRFFSTHECTTNCAYLKLKSPVKCEGP